ncbi:MAG: flavodoxin family protein [Sedimentisphaerales bacterium]|nr:flavodoxin family protein [Sedimentisphaerales bacterium]
MAKAIVIYFSKSGNTKAMAQMIAKAMNEAGLPTECKAVSDVSADEIFGYDAIVLGSPTYYGQMAAQLKQLIDDLVSRHGQLDGKVGAAFTSSGNVAGGNETTIMGIIEALLISGMIVQGDPKGDHYGPVSIGKPDKKVETQCIRMGKRIAELTKTITA